MNDINVNIGVCEHCIVKKDGYDVGVCCEQCAKMYGYDVDCIVKKEGYDVDCEQCASKDEVNKMRQINVDLSQFSEAYVIIEGKEHKVEDKLVIKIGEDTR